MLRACVSVQKRVSLEDLSNVGYAAICVKHNACDLEKYSVSFNARYFSTKEQQKVSEGKTEVYYGTLTSRIKRIKVVTLLTSATGLGTQPFLYSKAIASGWGGAAIAPFACIGLLTTLIPPLLHLLTRKYITHLYYDAREDKYIANTYSLFVRKKELEFKPEDVTVPDITGMFTTCYIKGNPFFLDENSFYDFNHYIRIMGYDKPVDLKLNNNNITTSNQTVLVESECKNTVDKK